MAPGTQKDTRETNIPECVIIKEIYENEDAHADFEMELEKALEAQAKTIVIEPSRLGEETARWITIGNCLHKTTVLSGLGCLGIGWASRERAYLYLPLGFLSVVCGGVYAVSWQFDPCCKYQVEYNIQKLEKLPLFNMNSDTPVVLVRRDDSRRKALHNTVSMCAAAFCAWKMYKWLSD